MLSRILSLAVGCRRIRIPGGDAGKISAQLLGLNVPVWGMSGDEDGISFFVSLPHEKKLISFLKSHGTEPVRAQLFGLPRLAFLYRKRFGFFLGIVFFALFVLFCSSRVWEVRVFGAENGEVLRAKIASAGLCEGMAVTEFDEELFRTRFLAENPDFTFVSASVIGSTALVRLNARVPEPEIDDPDRPANLVAVREGVIVRCEAGRGIPLVANGDCVAPGQILVSGVSETPSGAYTLHRSEGRVLARTKRRFETKISLGEGQKRFTGEIIKRVSLTILGKNINIFDFSGNPGEFYDTIEEKKELSVFGVFRLPFSLLIESRLPYRLDASPVDEETARKLLWDRYHAFVSESLGDAQIISSEVTFEREGDAIKLVADLGVIENIAVVSEIKITDPIG
ncbi:MAG: sporulation protein YqfD [Clostridia bacterium]|nr:sporulation protein YqfD [Clostridia bacterium]